MPRTARQQSDTGVYHAILRGVNKQQIFECSEDYERFINILRDQTKRDTDALGNITKPHCVIYAYCQMGNHVHLLVKELGESLGDVMKRISSSYVYYYNHKYGRIGHLFQERFKSQPVSEWEYFLTLLRYIHQNPLKPHLVEHLQDYRWSSWLEYIGKQEDTFCATHTVLERISLEDLSALVCQPLSEEEEKDFIDVEETPIKTYFSDEEVWQILYDLSGVKTLSDFQKLDRPEQKHYLWEAHEKGIGPRALSRLTGVPYSIVQRATSAAKERYLQESFMVHEDSPEDELWHTYCDDEDFKQYPEY